MLPVRISLIPPRKHVIELLDRLTTMGGEAGMEYENNAPGARGGCGGLLVEVRDGAAGHPIKGVGYVPHVPIL